MAKKPTKRVRTEVLNVINNNITFRCSKDTKLMLENYGAIIESPNATHYVMIVSMDYDVEEVADYIKSLNEES